MANVTKPIALNETFKTTGNSPKNVADVINDNGADLITQATAIVTQLQALINAVKPNAADIPLAPITGMSADDVQEGISELKSSLDVKQNIADFKLQTISGGYRAIIPLANGYKLQFDMTSTLYLYFKDSNNNTLWSKSFVVA